MPQISPMNWILISLMLISTFLILNLLNFFSFKIKPMFKKMKLYKNKNWKCL